MKRKGKVVPHFLAEVKSTVSKSQHPTNFQILILFLFHINVMEGRVSIC